MLTMRTDPQFQLSATSEQEGSRFLRWKKYEMPFDPNGAANWMCVGGDETGLNRNVKIVKTPSSKADHLTEFLLDLANHL